MEYIWMILCFFFAGSTFFLWRRIGWLKMDMERVERSRSELSDELVRLEYLRLSQQIQPHFVFNALNLLLSLARLDRKEELLRALEHLGLFLRSGYATRPSQVTVGSELDMAEHYLAIQQMRFGKRLTVEVRCSEACRGQKIIPYLLQTFIENAFKHGLEKQTGDVKLAVFFYELPQGIRLSVEDNGPEPDIGKRPSSGAGLRNLRRRLDILYGSEGGIELQHKDGKTRAIAWWPFEVKKGLRRESKAGESDENTDCR